MGKQLRARTGCLTCRDRHIKCDETLPRCRNCAKSDRVCERGLRLNFIDIQTISPVEQLLPGLKPGTELVFRDESRSVAAGYRVHSTIQNGKRTAVTGEEGECSPSPAEGDMPANGNGGFVASSRLITAVDEGLLMEVFVERVGPWMDCLDATKPFTNLAPFYALGDEMVLNAMKACGAQYLGATNASTYYDRASQELLARMEDAEYDQLACVVGAALLNGCEAMGGGVESCDMASSSAVMRSAGVDGTSSGLEGACFWTSVTMALLSCLCYDVPLPWDPEELGIDIDAVLPSAGGLSGDEAEWAHRVIYICARIAVLRLDIPSVDGNGVPGEWEKCKGWCEDWANNVPRSMMPLCYIPPREVRPRAAFPHVLLVRPEATVARLLYHTSCLLLARVDVGEFTESQAQRTQTRHAFDICGIASLLEEKETSMIAMYCILIAADSLQDSEAKEEALQIFDKLARGTPWDEGSLREAIHRKLESTLLSSP